VGDQNASIQPTEVPQQPHWYSVEHGQELQTIISPVKQKLDVVEIRRVRTNFRK